MEAVLHEDKLLTFGGGAPDLITEFREVFNRIMCLLSCIFPLLRPSLSTCSILKTVLSLNLQSLLCGV